MRRGAAAPPAPPLVLTTSFLLFVVDTSAPHTRYRDADARRRRQAVQPLGGRGGARRQRAFIHSRFRRHRTITDPDHDITASAFARRPAGGARWVSLPKRERDNGGGGEEGGIFRLFDIGFGSPQDVT